MRIRASRRCRVSRYARRACGGSAGTTASAISSLPSGPSSQRHDDAVDAQRGRRAGDEQQIAGDLPTTCSSHGAGARAARVAGRLDRRRTAAASAFSSLTSASRSSGSDSVVRRSQFVVRRSGSWFAIRVASNVERRTPNVQRR